MITARQRNVAPIRPSKITSRSDAPEQLRVFSNGRFVFAAFEYGDEIVVDLSASSPKMLQKILTRVLL